MQQHQALRLALGSILTPKRPPVHQTQSNTTTSRPSSGATSPAAFYTGTHSSSGSHTPIGSPPSHPSVPTSASGVAVSYYPLAHGPNSSEHLHPYAYGHPNHARQHGHGHSHTHIPLPPSRLGPGRSSPTNSPTSSAPNSTYPSPSVNSIMIMSPPPSDIEPLSMPPPVIPSHPHHVHTHAHHHPHHPYNNNLGGIDPPPPTPSTTSSSGQIFHHPSSHDDPSLTPPHSGDNNPMMAMPSPPEQPTSNDHFPDVTSNGSGHASGRGTPRAKFLEALQGKSAWDALIHGSFS